MSTQEAEAVTIALTFVRTAGATAHTVVVSATATTAWAQIRPLLPHGLGEVTWYADAQPVPDDATVGSPPLLHATELTDRPRQLARRALLELAVAEGPDAGQTAALRDHLVLGRAPEATLRARDTSLSRAHARIDLHHGQVTVRDLGSTNATWVDTTRLGDQPHELRVGQRLRTGSTVTRIATVSAAPPLPIRSGRRALSRPPRQVPQLPTTELTRPQPPQFADLRIPWLMLLFPLPIAIVLALVLRSPMFLAFAVFSPLMMLGHYLHERIGGRQSRRAQRAEFRRRTAELEEEVEARLDQEVRDRRHLAPDLAEVAAGVRTGRCWARRPGDPDHLMLRLGTGKLTAGTTVRGVDQEHETYVLEQVPIVVTLTEHPVCGLAGPPEVLDRAVDSLVGQLVATHSPALLQVVVVTRTPDRWGWLAWAPHVRPDTTAHPLILDPQHDDQQLRSVLGPWTQEPDRTRLSTELVTVHTVVLLDGPGLTHLPLPHALVRHGRAHGVAVLAAAPHVDGLPADCTATVVYDGPTTGQVLSERGTQGFGPDLPAEGWRDQVGRVISGTLDTTPGAEGGEPPGHVRLLDLLEAPPTTDRLRGQWQHHPRRTEVLLGVGAEGPVVVDLVRDGPHALVGGTTGSGKSELLQTLITSLALGNRPDELVFLLVDYKGGAAFKDCVELPHTVGLVTDLDPFLTQRALSSLDAEIRRRERLLAAAGAKDLADYQAMADENHPSIPRLVLVIDEFRVLADELPDFIDGVVRLAAVGRSLGIHIVLATQRPAGIVSADIRANVNLRIALRVRDTGDSEDIIESPAAARISTHTPGRALMRTGTAPPVAVQSARVSGSASAAQSLRVLPVEPGTARVLATAHQETPRGASDLRHLVDVLRDAAVAASITPVSSPWLPPLPPVIARQEIARPDCTLDGAAVSDALPVVTLGMLDRPSEQQQVSVAWALGSGHLAVVGGPRSGRTTTVRTVALDLVESWTADEVHLYVIDTSGALGALAALPHTGAVLDGTESTQIGRMVSWLGRECTRRQQVLAAGDHADLGEQWRTPGPDGRLPQVVLMIDGWDAFQAEYEIANPAVVDTLLQVLRDGPAVGLSVVVTGGRAVLSGRVAGLLQHRLVLRMADEMDLVMAGLRPSQVPSEMPPGRALLLPDGHEVQVAAPTRDLSGAAQSQALRAVGGQSPAPGQAPPKRFAGLPESVTFASLVPHLPPVDDCEGLLIGVGGEGADPIRWLPDPVHGPVALIAGPPGSGRSTALGTLAAQLTARGPVHWLAAAGPPPFLPPGVDLVPDHDVPALVRLLDRPFATLVIDDAELLTEALDDLAIAFLDRCASGAGALLLAGTTHDLMSAFRGVGYELRRRQSGLILNPSRGDGDLLGAQVPHSGRALPGRGVLVHRARSTEIQVVHPPRHADRDGHVAVTGHTGAVVQ